MRQRLSLRPVTAADEPFLRAVFRSTRDAELALLPLDDAQKDAFCTMQFTAQDRGYRSAYPQAELMLVLHDDVPIGRLYLAHVANALLVVDISLLPAWRNRGIGTALLRDVIERAAREGLSTELQVATTHRARRLYARLGFEPFADSGMYLQMRRAPTARDDSCPAMPSPTARG